MLLTDIDLPDAFLGVFNAGNIDASSMRTATRRCARGIA
jgi:hypothetical protein